MGIRDPCKGPREAAAHATRIRSPPAERFFLRAKDNSLYNSKNWPVFFKCLFYITSRVGTIIFMGFLGNNMKPEYRIKTLRRIVGKAINRHGMIGDGERILVALSGGVDSLVLLDAVAGRRRWLPITYSITAAHIRVQGLEGGADVAVLGEFCRERGVELIVRRVSGNIDFSNPDSRCFYCSWHRRKALFALMRERGCSRLAFGHHLDDVIETLILNMTFNARLTTMPLRLSMFGGEFDIIRPLGLLTKREVEDYARAAGLSAIGSQCPWSDRSKRADAGRVIDELERINPDARVNIFRSMHNIDTTYLPSDSGGGKGGGRTLNRRRTV